MLNRILLGLLCSAVVGCGQSGGGNDNSAKVATCDFSKGTTAAQLSQPTESLISGEYQFQSADYLSQFKGESLLVTEVYGPNENGDLEHSARIACPGNGKISEAAIGQVTDIDYFVPDVFLVNEKKEIEIPATFSILSLTVQFKNGQVKVNAKPREVSSLQKLNINKDEVQKIPGLKVSPTVDGFVVSFTDNSGTETRYFFRLVKELKPTPEKPTPEPEKPKQFTKEQCLERTQVQLGKISKDLINFSKDCSWIHVIAGIPQVQVAGVLAVLPDSLESCGTAASSMYSARVILDFTSGEAEVLSELRRLNPDSTINMNIYPVPSQTAKASYLKNVDGSQMYIPLFGGWDDPKDPNRSVITFSDFVRGEIILGPGAICKYLPELREYRTRKADLTKMMINEFAIELGLNK